MRLRRMKEYARSCGVAHKEDTSRKEVVAKMRDAHNTYAVKTQEEAVEARRIKHKKS